MASREQRDAADREAILEVMELFGEAIWATIKAAVDEDCNIEFALKRWSKLGNALVDFAEER